MKKHAIAPNDLIKNTSKNIVCLRIHVMHNPRNVAFNEMEVKSIMFQGSLK